MIVSMTGFGRSVYKSDNFAITVEMKTVNHRFAEYNIRMPRQLFIIEDKIKKKISEYVTRGRVEVFITIEGTGHLKSSVSIDWELLDQYYRSINMIQEKYQLEHNISLQDILSRDEFISIEENHSGNEELESLVLSAIEEAAKQLKSMRVKEGEQLNKDIHNQLTLLRKKVIELSEFAPTVVLHYSERLRKRMEDFVNGVIDETRIVNEVAIFADKADINEELTRLQSHIEQFLDNMKRSEPIGRKLDFLLQEMNREVNTIGSKANDSGVAREVVEMKSLLEKMKEQVQNIE